MLSKKMKVNLCIYTKVKTLNQKKKKRERTKEKKRKGREKGRKEGIVNCNLNKTKYEINK